MRTTHLLLTAFVAAALPAEGRAQVVLGRVVDEAARQPVDGVFVALHDLAGTRRAGVLTAGNGRFIIRAPAPGEFALHATRIGYEPAEVRRFTLQRGDTLRLEIPISEHAIRLESLVVGGERRCRSRPESAVATARLWQDIRSALEVASWVEDGWGVFRVLRQNQLVDTLFAPVAEPELEFVSSVGRNSFESVAVDSLLRFGFVQPTEGGRLRYYGPDAALLLSAAFLDNHCFGIARDRARPGLVALTFEPLRDRRVTGIAGGLWVDERTSELRYVEYRFTRLAMPPEAQRLAGGRTEFSRLDNGAWIIPRWEIRSPRPGEPGSGLGLGGAGVTTGELLGFTLDGEPAPLLAMAGTVFDSLAARPLSGGRVVVHGTRLSAGIAADGSFRIDSVTPGSYYLSVEHARNQLLPRPPLPVRVEARDAADPPITLAIPSRSTSLARFCTTQELSVAEARLGLPAQRLGLVSGTVRAAEGDSLPADLRVRVRWAHAEGDGWEERLGDDGSFRICGVPQDVDLFVEVGPGRRTSQRVEPGRLRYGFLRLTIDLPPH